MYIPDERSQVFIISNGKEYVSGLELVDEVDSQNVGWKRVHVT